MAAPSLIGPPDDSGPGGTESAPADSASGGVTVKLPLDLLGQDGVPPQQGDQVQAQIDATVQSVSGSMATLSIDAIDGQPVGQPDISDTGGGPAPGSSAAMKAALLAGAGQNQMGIGQ